MFLHPCFLAPLGEPFVSDADSPSAVRGPGDGHCAVSAQTEDLAPVYPFCRGGVSDLGGGRRHRGSFTVEASLLLVIILLVLALVMGLAVKHHRAVLDEAREFEAEAVLHEEERFVPRDLIRLCQFIEVWIPKKE